VNIVRIYRNFIPLLQDMQILKPYSVTLSFSLQATVISAVLIRSAAKFCAPQKEYQGSEAGLTEMLILRRRRAGTNSFTLG